MSESKKRRNRTRIRNASLRCTRRGGKARAHHSMRLSGPFESAEFNARSIASTANISRPATRTTSSPPSWRGAAHSDSGGTPSKGWEARQAHNNRNTRRHLHHYCTCQAPGGLDFRRSARRFSFPLPCRVRGGTWLASVLRAALRGDPSGSFGGVPHPLFLGPPLRRAGPRYQWRQQFLN